MQPPDVSSKNASPDALPNCRQGDGLEIVPDHTGGGRSRNWDRVSGYRTAGAGPVTVRSGAAPRGAAARHAPSVGSRWIDHGSHGSGGRSAGRRENFRLTLGSLIIEGATAYGPDDLRPIYSGLIGREVTVADLFKVANDIEFRYRNDGYITSRVIVPAQTVEDGTFRLKVVEGFASDIVYPDDIGPAPDTVKRLVDPLRGVTPINVADVERRLLLANDLPGLTVRANLEPAPATLGASVIVVKTDRKAAGRGGDRQQPQFPLSRHQSIQSFDGSQLFRPQRRYAEIP